MTLPVKAALLKKATTAIQSGATANMKTGSSGPLAGVRNLGAKAGAAINHQTTDKVVSRGLDALATMFGVKDDKKADNKGVQPAKDPKQEATKDARTSGPTGFKP